MIAHFRGCQSEQCGRKEHGFVIGMGDEKADPFVTETGEGSSYDLRCV